MTKVKVSVSINNCGAMIPVSPHTNPTSGGIAPYAEPPVPMWWPPGRAAGQNKFAKTVQHQGYMIVQQGHDTGVLIPHIGPPIGFISATGGSSRKVNFSASTVRMNGSPAAAASLFKGMPMSICADPCALPQGDCDTVFNTVFVGVTSADMKAGWSAIGVGIVASLISSKLPGGKGSESQKKLVQWALGQAVGAVASVAAGCAQVEQTGQGTVGFSLGVPPMQFSFGVNFDNHQWTSVGGSAGPVGVQYNRDGTVQGTGPTGSTDPYGTPKQPANPNVPAGASPV